MQLSRFRPRITVRRLMVAVAIVGFVLGIAGWMERRKSRFNELFVEHLFETSEYRPHSPIKQTSAHRSYYKKLAIKYGHAADHPWLPVAPDPPEPE